MGAWVGMGGGGGAVGLHVEENGVRQEGGKGVSEDEVHVWWVADQVEGHDGTFGECLAVEEQREAEGEEDERCDHKGVTPWADQYWCPEKGVRGGHRG